MLQPVTVMDHPQAIVANSQYGTPSFARWCQYERDRIRRHGVDAHVIRTGGTRICIAVLKGEGYALEGTS